MKKSFLRANIVAVLFFLLPSLVSAQAEVNFERVANFILEKSTEAPFDLLVDKTDGSSSGYQEIFRVYGKNVSVSMPDGKFSLTVNAQTSHASYLTNDNGSWSLYFSNRGDFDKFIQTITNYSNGVIRDTSGMWEGNTYFVNKTKLSKNVVASRAPFKQFSPVMMVSWGGDSLDGWYMVEFASKGSMAFDIMKDQY